MDKPWMLEAQVPVSDRVADTLNRVTCFSIHDKPEEDEVLITYLKGKVGK